MRTLGFALACLLATACSKSRCEKYGDMEVKCGKIPDKERDLTRALATGMCTESDSDDSKMKELGLHFKQESECAEKYTECSEYKACTDALK